MMCVPNRTVPERTAASPELRKTSVTSSHHRRSVAARTGASQVRAAGAAVGIAFVALPKRLEWIELALGVPLILIAYGLVLWRRGFGPEDRKLFQRH